MANNGDGKERTVVGVFDDEHGAERAIEALHDHGFSEEEVSLIGPDKRGQGDRHGDRPHGGHDLTSGTTWGAGIGGGMGLLAGAGALAIPGFGPLLAMGPLAAALTGAATGGIAGGLTDWGIPPAESKHLEEDVKRGEFVTVVRTDHDAEKAQSTMRECGAHDVDLR